MTKLAVRSVSQRYGTLAVLRDVTLSVAEGEFVAVVGPSGCGKSTLLRIWAGLERPSSGEVAVDGCPLEGPDPRRMLVFQEDALYPWRTVAANVALGLEIAGWPAQRRRERVGELLEAVGLGGFDGYYPHQLSGGMRQRLSLARALALDPEVLLLDEPYGALDALTRLEMQEELLRLWERTGKTVVLITHDVEEALFLADRVAVMSPRPGRLLDEMPVSLPRPRRRDDPALGALKGRVLEGLGVGRALAR
ncbi:ABC transporter ATP-binding protein [Limnochorda pilosa]|uniref:ABC-type quaternary amine transporter n=1 Tax=Limnochorda pilosa TaxID=1555112 RepID=A0A0K2SHX0_LIMPI|nr:ABC transporter ATP-binding protein [Limnochorda pilosa]BAS26670.1 ABC transporter ATP-binding protein [Limnochorda pilosa]